MIEDWIQSQTSQQQHELEQLVAEIFKKLADSSAAEQEAALRLRREDHITYLHGGLRVLPSGYVSLDASRPWICYWIVHSLALLGASLPPAVTSADIISFLQSCQAQGGGYGGGPRQLPHLAPSYATVAALVTLGGTAALSSIDTESMMAFLLSMAVPPGRGGGFQVCQGGETDVRGCYTAMAIAHMLRLDKQLLAEKAGLADFIRRCQTYEGGIGGEPGSEAHGGYTYCGLAAACLAGCTDVLDLPALHQWALSMQGEMEGGFRGRTNKLVDGCYSFWQGSLFPLLRRLHSHDAVQHPSNMSRPAVPGPVLEASQPAHDLPSGLAAAAGRAADAAQEAAEAAVRKSTELFGSLRAAPESKAAALSAAASAQEQAARAVDFREAAKVSAWELCPPTPHLPAGRDAAGQPTCTGSSPSAPLAHLCHAVHAPPGTSSALPPSPSSASRPRPHPGSGGSAVNTSSGSGGSCQPEVQAQAASYNSLSLQLWVLGACQGRRGGLRDKPGKPPDYYHTCYCLSGLASAQHEGGWLLGPRDNLLEAADPLCNVLHTRLAAAVAFFGSRVS